MEIYFVGGIPFTYWESEMKLLGWAVSWDGGFIVGLSMKSFVRVVELIYLLLELRDLKKISFFYVNHAWLLSNLIFCLRMYQQIHTEKNIMWFDKELWRGVGDIVVGGGHFFGNHQCRVTFLLVKIGGFGLFSVVKVAPSTFIALRIQSWML